MRKQIFSTVLVLLIFCTSCAVQQDAPSSVSDEESIEIETSAQTEGSTEITELTILGDPFLFNDLDLLVKVSDIIIIGTVEEALPVVRVEAVSLGLVSGSTEDYKNISSYNIKIYSVIKGDVVTGDFLRVDMSGGVADGVYENHVGLNYPVEGTSYLIFIDETNISDKTDYFKYMFVGTYDGFSEIIDGKLYPQENTSIFKSGTPIEEAIARITEAMEGRPSMESN